MYSPLASYGAAPATSVAPGTPVVPVPIVQRPLTQPAVSSLPVLATTFSSDTSNSRVEIFSGSLIPDHPAWAWLKSQLQEWPGRGRVFLSDASPISGQQSASVEAQLAEIQRLSGGELEPLPDLGTGVASQETATDNLKYDYGVKQRLVYSLVKVAIVGSAPFWTLVLARNASVLQAALVGVTLGAMSGALLFYGPQYHDFLTQKPQLTRLARDSWVRTKRVFRTIEEILRWDLSEVAYVGIGELVLRAVHLSSSPSLLEGLFTAAVAAQYSTVTQSFWDLALAKIKYRLAASHPDQAASFQRQVDIGGIGVSFVSVGLALAQMLHVPHTEWGFLVFGGTGLAFYLVSLYQNRKLNALPARPFTCQGILGL